MAMTTHAEVLLKAGLSCSADVTSSASTTIFMNMAEGVINSATRFDWTGITSSAVAGLLSDCASSLAAIDVIKYDMSAASRIEMEDRINVLRDAALRDLSILRDSKVQEYVKNA